MFEIINNKMYFNNSLISYEIDNRFYIILLFDFI